VDYLVEEFRWGKKGVKIEAHDLSKTATRDKLIQFIEKRNLEKDVRDIMEEVWLNAEKQCEVRRKKRY
jgi:5,10-methylene-tetrahydrofolate dehydrogenase/methenyl tetrahydrofolate cyclohydrolase